MKLSLTRDIKDNKKGKKTSDNGSLLLNEVGDVVSKDMEKFEVLNAIFASVFTTTTVPQEKQALGTRGKDESKEDLLSIKDDQVRKWDRHKSMDPDGMHPEVLKKLADVIARPVSIIFDQSWQVGEVPEDWKKTHHSHPQNRQEGRPTEL